MYIFGLRFKICWNYYSFIFSEVVCSLMVSKVECSAPSSLTVVSFFYQRKSKRLKELLQWLELEYLSTQNGGPDNNTNKENKEPGPDNTKAQIKSIRTPEYHFHFTKNEERRNNAQNKNRMYKITCIINLLSFDIKN